MRRIGKLLLIVMAVVLAALIVIPFLIPVPPLEGTKSPQELADADSQFIEINGIDVHYKLAGEGDRAFVLLHGFAASTFSWREIMEPLGQHGTVIAFDRPAFGLTERPMEWEGDSPYSYQAQVELTIDLMDAMEMDQAVLIGNSAGGRVAMLTALKYPERVEGLILIDPAIYEDPHQRGLINGLLRTPQMRRLGPLITRRIQAWGLEFAESSWHDPSLITDEIWAGYTLPTQAENWDRALWEYMIASNPIDVSGRLAEFDLPVLVITGNDDRIVPTEESVRAAGEITGAELVIIENCGHVPHEECPDAVMDAIRAFLDGLE